MYKVIFSPHARKNLKDISLYIAEDNAIRAVTFIDEMMVLFIKRLSEFPLSCQKVKGEVRMLPYKKYGILYIVDEVNMIVKVLHIVSGGQDWSEWN
jgi:plasmid stabilization system protein ParE